MALDRLWSSVAAVLRSTKLLTLSDVSCSDMPLPPPQVLRSILSRKNIIMIKVRFKIINVKSFFLNNNEITFIKFRIQIKIILELIF